LILERDDEFSAKSINDIDELRKILGLLRDFILKFNFAEKVNLIA